jgi:hypothetical protein
VNSDALDPVVPTCLDIVPQIQTPYLLRKTTNGITPQTVLLASATVRYSMVDSFDLQEELQGLQDVATYQINQEHDISSMDARAIGSLLEGMI